ncbi:MAG: hypothetical protein WBN60_08050, partial [Polyangiales bacterium]
ARPPRFDLRQVADDLTLREPALPRDVLLLDPEDSLLQWLSFRGLDQMIPVEFNRPPVIRYTIGSSRAVKLLRSHLPGRVRASFMNQLPYQRMKRLW